MCGHGTIGVVATLAYLKRIGPGEHHLELRVGAVTATLHADGQVSVANVPSYRKQKAVTVACRRVRTYYGRCSLGRQLVLPRLGTRPVAWTENANAFAEFAWMLRQAVNEQYYPEVDHVELFGPPTAPGANARNFVLCPGKAYDRSPCGTGTSATPVSPPTASLPRTSLGYRKALEAVRSPSLLPP